MGMRNLNEVRKLIDEAGIPGKDECGALTIGRTFPDKCHYRVEISGIESVNILKATIDEAKKQGVPFHRAISLVRGATLYTDEELKEFATVAHDNKVEVIITPGPRPTWYTGKQPITPEGIISGLRLRGSDMITHYVADILRCIDLGFRGFLVWDEGVLGLLDSMRGHGVIPKETTFKMSIFAGCANSAGASLLELLGAGTFNPVGDLTVSQLATIRSVVDIPMDVHIQLWASMGGLDRTYETPEIAKVASPVYFKMEPGPGLGMYMPWGIPDAALAELARQKIRSIRNIVDLIENNYPDLKLSKWGAGDLRVPVKE